MKLPDRIRQRKIVRRALACPGGARLIIRVVDAVTAAPASPPGPP